MNKGKVVGSVMGILLGGAMFVFGEIDDSPGGQLFGFIIAVISLFIMFNQNEDKIEEIKNK